jgi:hypothetical protein
MPYIVTEESLPGFKDDLQGKFIVKHEKEGPLLDVSTTNSNKLHLTFASGVRKYTEDNVLEVVHDEILEFLFLLGKKVTAVMPDENNEDWSYVGVDSDMENHVGSESEVKKVDFVEGVLSVYLENDYWHPISALENDDTRNNITQVIDNFYAPIPEEGWIKKAYKVGNNVYVLTMMDNWFCHHITDSFYTHETPDWLKEGSYVVLLNSCNKHETWGESIPTYHVYKLRQNANRYNFIIDKDKNGSITNGWYIMTPNSYYGGLKLKPATPEEIESYNRNDWPVFAPSVILSTTPAENINPVEEKVVEIKTKRISSKNYL